MRFNILKLATDNGICFSFNKAKADEIYANSTYVKTIGKLQQLDQYRFQGNFPSWFFNNQEPKVKPSKNMRLCLVIDSNRNYIENLSFKSDFESLDVLIGLSGDLKKYLSFINLNCYFSLLR